MDDSTEDEEESQLKTAIALSLQEQTVAAAATTAALTADPVKHRTEFIDLSADDDPIELDPSRGEPKSTAVKSNAACPAFLGLDRKAMEQERLARKRKALEPSLPPATSDNRVCDESHEVVAARECGTCASTQSSALGDDETRNKKARIESQSEKLTNSNLQYPKGIVKKTWALGFPREDDIKIEEVLERSDLTLAVLSSFQWDVEWLMRKIDVAKTKMIFIMQAKDESTKEQYRRETADMPTLRLCFPSMEGQVNCMHSKLMLLAHPSYLRIVVPTANLVPYDWGEGGVMENMVFLIDLPRLPDGQTTSAEDLTFFGQELVSFCQAMGLQKDVVHSLRRFDFSETKEMAFVHTIGGAHTGDGEPWRRTGYCGLGRAVKQLGLSTRKHLDIDFVTSSIGALDLYFLTMIYLAAQGDDGLQEYEWRTNASGKTKAGKKGSRPNPAAQVEVVKTLKESFRIFFPSRDTVVRSRGGPACGGVICFSSKWYTASNFPQEVLRDCKSMRQGMLMHNKVCLIGLVQSSG